MNRVLFRRYFPVIAVILLLLQAGCFSDNGDDESSGFTSHNTGNNCLQCHTAGGSGDGIFTAAGSVYHTDGTTVYAGVTVNLMNGSSVAATMVSDNNGNFYTGGALDFGSGLTPAVVTSGGTRTMASTINNGGCNQGGCHDSNRRIVAD